MLPDVNVAKERARMTAKMNHLRAVGTALLLQSVTATAPVEAQSLHQEAVVYLTQADEIHDYFVAHFPNSLNLYKGGR